ERPLEPPVLLPEPGRRRSTVRHLLARRRRRTRRRRTQSRRDELGGEQRLSRPVHTRGFTFIEMMVVLAIIGLAAAVAVPAIEAGLDAREVRRATRQIAATMHHLRGEAVATGRMRRLRINPAQNAIETDDRSRWAVLTDRAIIERIDGGIMA